MNLNTHTHTHTHTHRFEKRREMERESHSIAIEWPMFFLMFEWTLDAEVGVFQVAEMPTNSYEYGSPSRQPTKSRYVVSG